MARPPKHAATPHATCGRPKTDIPPARAAARIMQLEHDLADAAARLSALATENESLAARNQALAGEIGEKDRAIAQLTDRLHYAEAGRKIAGRRIERLHAALAELALRQLDSANDKRSRDYLALVSDMRRSDEADAEARNHRPAQGITARGNRRFDVAFDEAVANSIGKPSDVRALEGELSVTDGARR